MALLQVLGLSPPTPVAGALPATIAAAAQQAGQRRFDSLRSRLKAHLINAPLAKAAQGDVSSRLTLKAGAEVHVAGLPAAVFAGKGEADFTKSRADVQKA